MLTPTGDARFASAFGGGASGVQAKTLGVRAGVRVVLVVGSTCILLQTLVCRAVWCHL